MSNDTGASGEELVAWVRAAAAGDREAAEEVLRAVQDRVYRLALRMLGHPQDAEDAAQEILIIVLTHLGSFRGESSFFTWVWRIAARRLIEVKQSGLRTLVAARRWPHPTHRRYIHESDPDPEVRRSRESRDPRRPRSHA